MSWVLGYGCTSLAGISTEALWQSLTQLDSNVLVQSQAALTNVNSTAREKILQNLLHSWSETQSKISSAARQRITAGKKVGVIFASTKGFIDDFIWQKDTLQLNQDALTPILNDLLKAIGVRPFKKLCLSNACASSISALYLAKEWLKQGQIEDVLIFAADLAGEFVQKGFATLKVLSPDGTRPFSIDRAGFFIGDASACLWLSKHRESEIFLEGVGVEAEGHAVTRPSQTGESLRRACLQISDLTTKPPQLIIAHGTATRINDATEDHVYAELFTNFSLSEKPLITASKWKTGHTLGPCGALDAILACETLARNEVFKIATTTKVDSDFRGRYLTKNSDLKAAATLSRVLFSSLGFGGIHAAALMTKRASL